MRSVFPESFSSRCRVMTLLSQTDYRRMDRHNAYRMILFNRACIVMKVNPSGKQTAYGAKCVPKQKTISNSNYISILGIPVTFSGHNGKCNICAFHEEVHAFEDWIFVRLSSLVLACEQTTNWKRFAVYLIDFDWFMMSEGSDTLILPFTSKTGQSVFCSTKQTNDYFILVLVLLVNRGHILAFL